MSTIELKSLRTPRESVRATSVARQAKAGDLARSMPFVILALLVAVSFTPFVLSAFRMSSEHERFLGVAGVYPFDQDQYLAYIASARDGLIRNLYGIKGSAVFVDPIWSPSGIVQRLTGVSSAMVMAFWTVVGALVLWAGCWRLVTRYVPTTQPWRRCVALLLALFGGMTLLTSVGHGVSASIDAGVGLDMVPAQTVWGYAPMAIAIGLMPFALEGMERLLSGQRGGRCVGSTAATSLLCGWLHPWQGATLFLIWAGLLVFWLSDTARAGVRIGSIGIVTASLLAGPIYFKILPMVDPSWAGFSRADQAQFVLDWRYLLFTIAPLLLFAIPGVVRLRREPSVRALLLWPLAVLLLVALKPPEVLHSFDGLMLPLAVLIVVADPRNRPSRRWSRLTLSGARAAFIVFSAVSAVLITNALVGLTQDGWLSPMSGVKPANVAAAKLAAEHAGGHVVLTPQEFGAQFPIFTDAATWVGDAFWTPNYRQRELQGDRFFLGYEPISTARSFVRRTGARALLEPCGWHFDLEPTLRPMGYTSQTVGCARVYWKA